MLKAANMQAVSILWGRVVLYKEQDAISSLSRG